jgi:hypothetical protein
MATMHTNDTLLTTVSNNIMRQAMGTLAFSKDDVAAMTA